MKLVEYLYHILGIKVRYLKNLQNPMPNFIVDRYKLQRVLLDDKPAVFVTPKGELDSINSVKKHIDKIRQTEDVPAILVLDKVTSRQKEYLLRDHVPFIVEGKQIYSHLWKYRCRCPLSLGTPFEEYDSPQSRF